MNQWLKKQIDCCIVGKKGVRDNLQIAVALLNYRQDKAKDEILEPAASVSGRTCSADLVSI